MSSKKVIKLPEDFDVRKIIGIYYGYPQCCIDSFFDPFVPAFMRDPIQREVAAGTGFFPCVKHANEVAEGKIKLEDLITDRSCDLLFPEQDDEDMTHTDKFVERYVVEHYGSK